MSLNNSPESFPIEGISPALEERIKTLEAQASVKELTALQAFSTHITWVVAGAILFSTAFICFVWYTHLPPVQSAGTTPEQLAAYREKSEIAGDEVEKIVKISFPMCSGRFCVRALGC